ncbi:hypothetical protein K461DRAFT_111455 [Myriangium duriaei CBS 260.36]|uniref:Secreted protein n=1 Tax=Myriangium duriaei CBS 260.36 TaxID=1168546 RepID=A0A9P4MQ60_9PEZI|nr:hypothetical protein K461DRAFT_111455 [Myriangium duriaei CBS 260.36]
MLASQSVVGAFVHFLLLVTHKHFGTFSCPPQKIFVNMSYQIILFMSEVAGMPDVVLTPPPEQSRYVHTQNRCYQITCPVSDRSCEASCGCPCVATWSTTRQLVCTTTTSTARHTVCCAMSARTRQTSCTASYAASRQAVCTARGATTRRAPRRAYRVATAMPNSMLTSLTACIAGGSALLLTIRIPPQRPLRVPDHQPIRLSIHLPIHLPIRRPARLASSRHDTDRARYVDHWAWSSRDSLADCGPPLVAFFIGKASTLSRAA